MKHMKEWAAAHKMAGLLTAGAMMLTEVVGVCMPVTVMAQDDLFAEEAILEDELIGNGAMAYDEDEPEVSDAAAPDDTASEEGVTDVTPDTNIFGNDPSTKSQYYVTFTIKNNGKEKTITKSLEKGVTKPLKDYDFYDSLMTEIDDFIYGESQAYLAGWSVYTDGLNGMQENNNIATTLNADGYTYNTGGNDDDGNPYTETFSLDGSKDYHFVAIVAKSVAASICVEVIPSVYYNGLEHVALGTKINAKKQAADLRIKVYSGGPGWSSGLLTEGKDYTLSYSNNKDASMELISEGEGAGSFKRKVSDDKRPKVTVTGKGNYKGFSAEAYFDIQPMNLGVEERLYSCLNEADNNYSVYYFNEPRTYTYQAVYNTGFDNGYKLEGGKVTGLPAQKVYHYYYTFGHNAKGKTVNKEIRVTRELTRGTDYDVELYKWDETKSCWINTGLNDPSAITAEGDYLFLVRGKGNYCGAFYSDTGNGNQSGGNVFNSGENGSPAVPQKNSYDFMQFKVTAAEALDFNKVKVSVKNKQLDYTGKQYGPDDFGISVKGPDGKDLKIGEDYYIEFKNIGGYHVKSTEGVHYGSKISAANTYSAYIRPMGNYIGKKITAKVTIKGVQLKPAFFVLSSKKVPYGQWPTWSVASGQKFVTGDDKIDDPYYVSSWQSSTYVVIGGSQACGDAIDPSKEVAFPISHSPVSLQSLFDSNALKIEVTDGEYNVKGAGPGKVTITQNGEFTWDVHNMNNGYEDWAYIDNIGTVYLKFSMKKNTKVGDTATLTVKASGVATGSKDFTYKVVPKKVTGMRSTNDFDHPEWFEEGDLVAVPVFGQQGKGKLDAPKIKLYQKYTDKKGARLAEVSAKMYKLEKKETVGDKGIAAKLVLKNSGTGEFDFGESGYELGEAFALYEKTIKANDIVSIKIDGNDLSVEKGTIKGDFFYTGQSICPNIESIKLTDGTELKMSSDFRTECGSNVKVGKGTGKVKLVMRYNVTDDKFVYGGDCTLKFDIKDAKTVKL